MGRFCRRSTVLLALLAFGVATVPGAAQQKASDPLVGTWVGALALPSGASVHVVFHVSAGKDGTLAGTMDSPDQGVTGIPLSEVTHTGAEVHLGVASIPGAFEGTMSEGHDSIVGTWTQGAASLALTLKRGAATLGRPAAPTPPAGVVEEPYAFEDGAQRLAGTLSVPAHTTGKVPVVLIIAGSGPTDRNGDNPLGDHAGTYRKLAWGLAERGIASLRYDKRGIGASHLEGSPADLTFGDYIDDAVAGARKLAADPRFSHVVLVGHSEGALLAECAANAGAPVAGVVTMAGMGRPFLTVLHAQLARALDSAQLAAYDRVLPAYLGSGPMPDVPSYLRSLLNPTVRRFIRTESKIDPAQEARRLRVPLMILQGTTDIQVSVADARALEAAQPRAELHILPDVNHVFVHVATTARAAQIATYENPSLPLTPQLVPLVAGFVRRVAG